jgi:uncharacterized protein DUF2188
MADKRIDIVKKGDAWIAESGRQPIMSAASKADLVRQVAATARNSGQPTSVRIHGLDGRIQEERSYGRRSDPRRSNG